MDYLYLSHQTSLAASSHRISMDANDNEAFFLFMSFTASLFYRLLIFTASLFDWLLVYLLTQDWTWTDPDRLKLISFAVLLNI